MDFMRPPGRTDHGKIAEDRAADFLAQRGVEIVARNYRCRFGEIDLIGRDGETMIFVEVRLRSNPTFGGPAGSITTAKQKRIILAAQHFLTRFRQPPPCRFDAILATRLSTPHYEWLKGAFETF